MQQQSKRRNQLLVLAMLTAVVTLAEQPEGAAQALPPNRGGNPPAPIRPGEALPDLSAAQRAAFNTGRDEFLNVETPESGLGPIFNGASCVQCHGAPAPGGSSQVRVTRFGRMVNGQFDPMTEKGGSLLQRFAINPAVREIVPPEATVVADRLSTPLFGAGLIEAIPDAAIQAGARRMKRDGVTGRAALVTDPVSGTQRVGRFGWKAQQATLLAFSGDAYLNEMGITNRFFPTENAPNGNQALLAAHDHYADPEDTVDPATGRSDIDNAADFMRLLAPVAPLALSSTASAGARLFDQIGCAECHQPALQTGPNAIAALDRKSVPLYSDLLLHDMGQLGDGIAQAGAGTREMRTAPLWGLRLRLPFLHDGRAATVEAAIRAHDGEASVARERFVRLGPQQAQQLLDFLRSL